MSPRVSLSLRTAKAFSAGGEDLLGYHMDELRAAIAKAQRSSTTRKKLRQPKESKRAAKREETSTIRTVVMARASHCCEACGDAFWTAAPGELDHFFGRGHEKQTSRNCWALCRSCHRKKTDGNPSAAFWLGAFIRHATKHGYSSEASRARARLQFVEARGGQ